MIIVKRYEKDVQVDLMKDGTIVVYNPKTNKIICEGILTELYDNETTQ